MSTEYTGTCYVSCNGCNSCNSTCNSVNGLCNTNQKASYWLGTFYWGSRGDVSTDEEFFTKDEWNSLIDHIKKAYQLGSEHNASKAYSSDSALRASDTNQFLSAQMYNKAYGRMKMLVLDSDKRNEDAYQQVTADVTIVTAQVINNLRSLANNFNLNIYQCNNCNNCNSCDNQCNNCNSCQGGYSSYCCHTETSAS